MLAAVRLLLSLLPSSFRSRASLAAEILALRHQITVYQRQASRPRLRPVDRVLWVWLRRLWKDWRDALVIALLLVFLVLATDRTRVLHFNVTEHPSAEWTARQVVQAFPRDTAVVQVREVGGLHHHYEREAAWYGIGSIWSAIALDSDIVP